MVKILTSLGAILITLMLLLPTLAVAQAQPEREFILETEHGDRVYRLLHDDGTFDIIVETPLLLQLIRSLQIMKMSIFGYSLPVTVQYELYMHRYWDEGEFRYITYSIRDVNGGTWLVRNVQHGWTMPTTFEAMADTIMWFFPGVNAENTRVINEGNVPYIELGIKPTNLTMIVSPTAAGDTIMLRGALRNDRTDLIYQTNHNPMQGVRIFKNGELITNEWSFGREGVHFWGEGLTWGYNYRVQPGDNITTMEFQARFEGAYTNIFEKFRGYVVYEWTETPLMSVPARPVPVPTPAPGPVTDPTPDPAPAPVFEDHHIIIAMVVVALVVFWKLRK